MGLAIRIGGLPGPAVSGTRQDSASEAAQELVLVEDLYALPGFEQDGACILTGTHPAAEDTELPTADLCVATAGR